MINFQSVLAGAGVFRVVAAWAWIEVDHEALSNGFGFRCVFDRENNGNVITFREPGYGKENSVVLREG